MRCVILDSVIRLKRTGSAIMLCIKRRAADLLNLAERGLLNAEKLGKHGIHAC